MKILFCGSSYQCGLTVLMTEHAIALHSFPEIELLMIFGENEQEKGLRERLDANGVKYVVIPGFDVHSGFFRLRRQLADIVGVFQPDWTMAQTNWQFMLLDSVRVFGELKFKLLYWIHGFRHNFRFKSKIAVCCIGTMLKLRADCVVASSGIVRDIFKKYVGKRLLFSFLGVDEIFYESPLRQSGKRDDKKLIVFAGQFRHGKCQNYCIEAARMLKERGYHDFQFILPGDGPELKERKAEVLAFGLEDVVLLPGFFTRERMIDLYHKSWLAVVPSNYETFGSCISEPIACGLPVASRPVGIAEDVIQSGKNGWFFDTAEELSDIIVKLHENSSQMASAREAIVAMKDSFRWRNICKQYLASLQEI